MELRAINNISDVIISTENCSEYLLKTINFIKLIYHNNEIYIKLSIEVFSEKEIELYKKFIQKTIEKEKSEVFIDFCIKEIDTNGDRCNKYNHLSCSYGIPNNICLLELNYTEITSIDYYFKINDINELNL